MSDAQRPSGWRMPAEWHRQAATWVAWPHNVETWPENLPQAQAEFVEFVRRIAADERVEVLAGGGGVERMLQAASALTGIEGVRVIDIPTNDAWARDFCPTFVVDETGQQVAAVDWTYNAWGGKYPPYDDDQRVARRVAEFLDAPCRSTDFVLEGGAIEINAQGVLLTTDSCVLDPHRNPAATRDSAEELLRTMCGARRVIWLPGDAITGDDTDGHIDQMARFIRDDAIVYAWTENPDDPQHESLRRNLEALREQIRGEPVQLFPLLLPREPVAPFGVPLPASYCNFYFTNAALLVPQFGDPHDERALRSLARWVPERQVIGVPSRHLVVGLGSLHCLTQQQPAAG